MRKIQKGFYSVEDLDLDNPMLVQSKPKRRKSKLLNEQIRQIPGWVLIVDRTHFIPIIRIKYNRRKEILDNG